MKKIKLFVAFIFLTFGFVNTSQAQCFSMNVGISGNPDNYIVTVVVNKTDPTTQYIVVDAKSKEYCYSNSCTYTFNYTRAELTGDGKFIECTSGGRGVGGCYQSEGCVVTITPH